jgi:rhamnosyltransferase
MGDGKGGPRGYSVGVVIRTWNEAGFLELCISSLKAQKSELLSELEIQVIDSYSTDGTIDLSRREGCTLVEIPKSEFNYGGSLNTGISSLDKELIVSLSAHAIPVDDNFLHEMLRRFDDPKVAGAYVKQVPWPDAPFLEKVRIGKTFDDKPRTFSAPKDPEMHFSNVASCFRRSLWEAVPFHALPSSEDFFWAEAMLERGLAIEYVPEAAVRHSHKDSCEAFAKRFYTILRNDLETNKRTPFRETLRVARAGLSHVKYALKTCLTEKGGLGEKLATIGRSFLEFFLIMKRHLAGS